MEVKLKFQDKFYDMIDHNKCPTSEKSAEKCILRNSYFHHSEPKYIALAYSSVNIDKYRKVQLTALAWNHFHSPCNQLVPDLREELEQV